MMLDGISQWRRAFDRAQDHQFDRLLRGLVPLGSAGMLSLSEILDQAFEFGDEALDGVVETWLNKYILQPLPPGMSPGRWASVLTDLFHAIAGSRLNGTGELLRRERERLQVWLEPMYDGPSCDPEMAYLQALAFYQTDQSLSSLWRRLALGEEMNDSREDRGARDTGLLGLRKLPTVDGRPQTGVPDALLQVLILLAGRSGVTHDEWEMRIRATFAAYPRSQEFWIGRFRRVLAGLPGDASQAKHWLARLLPQWGRNADEGSGDTPATAQPIPLHVSRTHIDRLVSDPDYAGTAEFSAFLDRHRAYARATGHTEYLVKTFCNVAGTASEHGPEHADRAVGWLREAMLWEPGDPRTRVVHAQTLWRGGHRREATNCLWEARQWFPWYPFIRTELARHLAMAGDLATARDVYAEAVLDFPSNPVCRNGLAGTLRQLGQRDSALLGRARMVYEEACQDFPDNPVCRTGLAETLRQLGKDEPALLQEARVVYEEACQDFPDNPVCRNGLAETLRQLGKEEPALLQEARVVYEEACRDFPGDAVCRNGLGYLLLAMDEVDEAEAWFAEAYDIDRRDDYAQGGLAEAWFIQSARTRDAGRRERARRMFQQLANGYADERLANFDYRWEKAVERGGEPFVLEEGSGSVVPREPLALPGIDEMAHAERLGRAMIALRHIEETDCGSNDQAAHAEHAMRLLEVAEPELEASLVRGFVVTRGLVLLARGSGEDALAYFREQIEGHGRSGWIGVWLGYERARAMVDATAELSDVAAAFDSTSGQFAFLVVTVIQHLARNGSEAELGEALRELFPLVRRLAAEWRVATHADADASDRRLPPPQDQRDLVGGSVADFIEKAWLEPSGIAEGIDIDDPQKLRQVVGRIQATQRATRQMLSGFMLAAA